MIGYEVKAQLPTIHYSLLSLAMKLLRPSFCQPRVVSVPEKGRGKAAGRFFIDAKGGRSIKNAMKIGLSLSLSLTLSVSD